MKKNFCKVCVLTFFVGTIFLFNASFVFAAITGNVDGTEYTYGSDSGSDNILTTKFFDGSYDGIYFDTASATKLTVIGQNGASANWNNDTSVTMLTDGITSIISLEEVKLANNNNLKATSLIISSGAVVTNNSKLIFDNIVINDTAFLDTDMDNISANEITNNGNFNITAGTENNIKITGTGLLSIKDKFNVNAEITQSYINISGKDVNVSSAIKASNVITIDNGAIVTGAAENFEAVRLENKGTLKFNADGNIKTEIIGAGDIQIIDGANVINPVNNEIEQSLITISENSSLQTNVINVTTIKNDGNLIFNGGSNDNNTAVTGGGFLTVTDNFNNKATINQSSVAIISGTFNNLQNSTITAKQITISDNACLITGIYDIDVDENIENNGLLEINSAGTNNNVIIGTGTLTVSSSVTNAASITQQTVRVSSELITSVENLTVENINLEEENSLLQITDENDTLSSALITGSGSIEKQGAGTLELSNTNTYSGKTTLTNGAIKISSGSNLGSSDIYMNGGKLIVNTEDEITLENKINTIENNDINIEVVSSTLTLSQEIGGAGNFVKTGSGTINLQAAQNSYTGNTQVLAGTLRGTTSNIKGKLIGTGEENSDTFEFYDNDTDVTLNEIDMTNYVGTFNKTGSSTMTVSNAFKANSANISAGTFVVNNVDTQNNFEIVNDIEFANSYLKGNSNIKAKNVIIGENAFIAPGNSTGTIKISGNLIFENGGGYQAEIGQTDSLETYNDKIEADSVTISNNNTSLNLINIEGSYYEKAVFEIIKANSDIETNFSTITVSGLDEDDLAFGSRFTYQAYNDADTMKVEISRKATDFANSPYLNLSHNQKEAAKAIDNISVGQSGDIIEVLKKLESYYYYKSTQDFDKLKAGLDDIAGVIYANSAFLTSFNTKQEHIYDKIKERISDNICYKWHSKIWAEYFYNTVNVGSNSNSAKFNSNVNGIFAGFDIVSLKSVTLGIAAGYGASQLKMNSDKTDMKDFNLGFYGGFENENWQIKAMALAGMQQYETSRQINLMDRTASSSYNGYDIVLDGQAGYKIRFNRDNDEHIISLIPFIGLTGSYNSIDGFREKGADSLNLKVNNYNNFIFQARAGAGVEGKVNKFGWYANLSLRQLLTENYNKLKMSLLNFSDIETMNIYSGEISKTSIGLNLGADYMLDDNWTVFANTLASFADKNNNFYFNVGLSYKFNCSNCSDKSNDLQNAIDAKNKQLQEINDRSKNLEDELARKNRELEEAEQREKDLKDMLQKYKAKILSEQEANKIRETKIKEIRLDEKPTFIFAKAKLTSNGRKSLKEVAKELEKYPNSEILIEGHTDNIGSDKYNNNLSLRRAAAIMEVLKRDYKVKNKMGIIGKGKKEPIYSNLTEFGRAKNRRVEIVVGAPTK